MGMAFDTLGYVRRLQDSGVERRVAEAHADLARDMLLADLVTRDDLDKRLTELELRLTIKMGGMLVVAVGVLVAAQSLFGS
jgi:hypothetical protein